MLLSLRVRKTVHYLEPLKHLALLMADELVCLEVLSLPTARIDRALTPRYLSCHHKVATCPTIIVPHTSYMLVNAVLHLIAQVPFKADILSLILSLQYVRNPFNPDSISIDLLLI